MAVFDAATGLPVALLLDNGFLTDIRTGAAGAVAADLLAPRDDRAPSASLDPAFRRASSSVVCAPCGRFRRVVAWSPTAREPRRVSRGDVGRGIRREAAASAEDVCAAADVLITATPAKCPLVSAEWLRGGMHVTALGSDSPGKQELDAECLDRADLWSSIASRSARRSAS